MTPGSNHAPWKETLAPFAVPSPRLALLSVATSLVPYLAIFVLEYLTLGDSTLLTVALAILNAGFLVRVFIVFHDCAHGSLLASKRANHLLGAFLGLFVLSPYVQWKHEHAVHHATAGDLDRRGVGDVPTLTVAEYEAKSAGGRLFYRLFRNPLVMFGIGPLFAMIIGPRISGLNGRPRMRNSVLGTNLALAVIVPVLGLLMGWENFLIVWAPSAMLAGSAGIWLFYVQHQFEDVYWQRTEDWDYADAALQGSSYLKLPTMLRFFTGNIGLHHVHHLNARIPFYYLPQAHDSSPVFASVPELSIWDGMRCVRLKLWDEHAQRMVTFSQAKRHLQPSPAAAA